jgi:hypothetical protein
MALDAGFPGLHLDLPEGFLEDIRDGLLDDDEILSGAKGV